jgi:hypothetical protein
MQVLMVSILISLMRLSTLSEITVKMCNMQLVSELFKFSLQNST